jgi:hypothetical protein
LISQLRPDSHIPPRIYELAAAHNVGMPIKRQGSSLPRIIGIVGVIIIATFVVWLGYNIYTYIAFIRFSQLYPNPYNIPSNQLSTYSWLQIQHDNFWLSMLQVTIPLLGIVLRPEIYTLWHTKLYICSDGLLKIYKKKDEAARWDEIKEYYVKGNNVSRIVKADESEITFLSILMDRNINALISKEVTDRLLPEVQARYERGEVVRFGDVEVSRKGIYRPGKLTVSWRGELTPWDEIGEIKLKRGQFSVYQVKPELVGTVDSQLSTAYVGKWQVWRKHGDIFGSYESYWPNLPVFFVLISMILGQRGETGTQEIQGFSQPLTFKEAAAIAARKDKRKKHIKIILLLISLPIAYFSYQASNQQPQQPTTSTDTQPSSTFLAALAHKPYYAPVPGTDCDRGKATWDEYDANTYTCQKDGLLMTQKNFQYTDEIDFSFTPDSSPENGNYIPHHYRVQVKATFVSGSVDTCVGIGVHLQADAGRQEFDVCADGSWYFYEEPLNSATETEGDSGTLPTVKSSYLIAVDVTDTAQTLIVDNKTVTTESDVTYSSTDEIALVLSGYQIPLVPIKALFSDFRYTPYNS